MVRNANDSMESPQEQLREYEDYIERKINKLNIYNVYWCFFELRSRSQIPTENILKNDALCKSQLIRALKFRKYSPRTLDIFLEESAKNSIPLPYVKWFYEDKRAALWLKMVLEKNEILSDLIFTESDVTIFIHNIIFNSNLFITNRILRNKDYDGDSAATVVNKKLSLETLKKAYIHSKVSSKDTKRLNNSNDKKINYTYQYMLKKYDIDNLIKNRDEKKQHQQTKEKDDEDSEKDTLKKINKNGYKQALICTDTIFFESTDAAGRLDHILASLDYWVFDTHWFATENVRIDEQKIANRGLFIKNMYEAWNAKQKRDRDKLKKKQGIDLTSDNKKNLKYLAKADGKTQREVLNDLVKSAYESTHKKARYQEIQQNPSFTNGDSFFDKIPLAQPVHLPSESNEKKSIPEDSVLNENAEELNSTYAAESARPSPYSPSDFFDNIPQTQASGLPSGDSEKEVIYEDISSIKAQEEPNSLHVESLGRLSTDHSQEVASNAVTSSQNDYLMPFRPEQVVDVESKAAYNERFIEERMAGKHR